MFLSRNVMMKYRSPVGEDGGDAGGGAGSESGDTGATGAAKIAAELAIAEAAKLAADTAKAAEAAAAGEKDGKPSDAEAKLLKDVMDKKNKLKASNDRVAALEADLKKFEGIDIEAVKALLNEKKASETKILEGKGEWDRLRAQMSEEHTKQVGEVSERLSASQIENQRLASTIGDLTVGNAFSTSQFVKEEVVIPVSKVRVLYGSHFEYQDGSVVAFDKPAGAKERTMLVDGKGDPLSFEASLKKIVDADPDRDQLLKSKMKTGSGSVTTQKAGAPAQKLDAPSGMDKISAALAKGALQK